MAELVPGPGFAFHIIVDTATPVVTAMGPFPAGTFLDRLSVLMYLSSQSGTSGLQLGFGVSPSAEETRENFNASAKVWRLRDVEGIRGWFAQITLTTGQQVAWYVDLGIRVESGSRSVLVFHDQADGADHYDLWVTLRTLTVVRALPVTR